MEGARSLGHIKKLKAMRECLEVMHTHNLVKGKRR